MIKAFGRAGAVCGEHVADTGGTNRTDATNVAKELKEPLVVVRRNKARSGRSNDEDDRLRGSTS
jgi:hypothetical protein